MCTKSNFENNFTILRCVTFLGSIAMFTCHVNTVLLFLFHSVFLYQLTGQDCTQTVHNYFPCFVKSSSEFWNTCGTLCGHRKRKEVRRLERVFRCCSACEMMEDYKEGYLMVWTNYMSPCSSIVGLHFKSTCDIISVTMAMHKVHKSVLQISVSVNYLKN